MTIRPELEAQILRYYHAEKWRPNTIAHQLHVHHTTVQRVLAQAGMPVSSIVSRPSAIDAYVSFIADTLKQFPTLTAARLYGMVCERGYRGSPDHFRHRVALLRPRRVTEAYLRLRTLPGEQGQVDWAHCGHLQIGRARRPLMAFVMVLSYSRRIYLRFFLDARMASFLAGHTGAFAALHGCPRILLYDNLKSAVLERNGDAIRFNPTLLAFAGHHRFEPRPVAVARGNEKGRVERAIRYIRGALLRGPHLHRSRRPERAGRGLVRGPGGRATVARGSRPQRRRGLHRGARAAAAAAQPTPSPATSAPRSASARRRTRASI